MVSNQIIYFEFFLHIPFCVRWETKGNSTKEPKTLATYFTEDSELKSDEIEEFKTGKIMPTYIRNKLIFPAALFLLNDQNP